MPFGIPFIKLFPVLFKFVSDPAKSMLKTQAKESEWLKARIIRGATWYNTWTVRLRFRNNDIKRTPEQIKAASKISDKKAIELGVELINSFVGTVISIVLIYAVMYIQNEQDAEKKRKESEKRLEEIKLMTSYGVAIGEIQQEMVKIGQQMDAICDRVEGVEKRLKIKPKKEIKVQEPKKEAEIIIPPELE